MGLIVRAARILAVWTELLSDALIIKFYFLDDEVLSLSHANERLLRRLIAYFLSDMYRTRNYIPYFPLLFKICKIRQAKLLLVGVNIRIRMISGSFPASAVKITDMIAAVPSLIVYNTLSSVHAQLLILLFVAYIHITLIQICLDDRRESVALIGFVCVVVTLNIEFIPA